jgi:hypothetical protein
MLWPANLNCELTEILNIIDIRLHGRLWLVYVFLLIISMLLGNEQGVFPVS